MIKPNLQMHPHALVVSLGCAKNLVDSEVIASQLIDLGYSMTSQPSKASLIVVNTCGFLESAVEEAIETVLTLSHHRDAGSCQCMVVAGCMVQRYGRKLIELLPEVDVFLGTSHLYQLREVFSSNHNERRRLWISRPRFLIESSLRHASPDQLSSAYVKIAEGCSNRCSFCKIPQLRGPYRSRTVEDVLLEVEDLASKGAREINLIAQDTTGFGSDRGDTEAFVRLLDRMQEVPGIAWIRILYAYPERITNLLLDLMANSSKIVPYLDIPLQHSVPRILQNMGRFKENEHPEALIERIRKWIPQIVLRTSLMVGFPGETESDFEELKGFVERVQFDHLGVFEFSPEKGVRAARMPDQVDAVIKRSRRAQLLDTQRLISKKRLESLVGKILPILIEGFHPETNLLLTGRMFSQAPEADGSVIITSGNSSIGQIVPARITRAHDYDVEAEILDPLGSESMIPFTA